MSWQSKKAFEVKWCIENLISWFQSGNDSLYSPQFFAETLSSTRWKLRLSRTSHLAEKYINLAIERDIEDDHPEPIALSYELSFMAGDGLTLKSRSGTTKFAPKTVSLELNVKEVEMLEEKNDAYLPDGNLIICCKLWKAWSTSKESQCSIRSVIGKKCMTLNGTINYFRNLNSNSVVSANFISPSLEISFISFHVSVEPYSHSLQFEIKKVESKSFKFCFLKIYFENAQGKKEEFAKTTNITSAISHESCSFLSKCTPDYLLRALKDDALKLNLEITFDPGVQLESVEYYENIYKKLTDESAVLESVDISNLEKENSCPVDNLYRSEQKDIPCDIEKNESSDEDSCSDTAGKMHLPFTTLKEDLSSLYNDRLFCDTKLQTCTETFPAHRNVLSARSPVFRKMFTTDMKEKAGECINVPDISSDTVHRMLQFLYTDGIGDLDMQSAKDLYSASDKYDIASLKQRCSSFMKRNLCPANVCEVIVLADMHQDKDLASAANEFVLIYDKEVFGSEEWRVFMKNFGNLAAEVMYLKCLKS